MRTITGKLLWVALCGVCFILEAEKVSIKKRTISSRPQSTVELLITEDRVFVGQPFYCTVRFIYDKQAYTVKSIAQPVCRNGEIENVVLISQRDEQISNEAGEEMTYGLCEWQALVYPTKPGMLFIEPFQVIAEHTNRRGNNFLGFSFTNSNTFFSNTARREVLPLPAAPVGMENASVIVGRIASAALVCDKVALYNGQACTLKYVIKGLCNASRLSHPVIELPPQLKAYPSTAMVHGDSVTFEYVLQAVKEGRYSIESQTIVYFDTVHERYTIVETQPISLHVMTSTFTEMSSSENIPDILQVEAVPTEKEDAPLDVAYIRRIEIPMSYFLFMVGSLFMIFIMGAYRQKMHTKYANVVQRMKYRRILYDLERRIKKEPSFEIIRFIYKACKDLHPLINFDTTMKAKQDEWNHFLIKLEVLRFNEDTMFLSDDILKQLYEWITYLKKI